MTSFMISLRQKANGAKIGPARYLTLDDNGTTTDVSQSAWRAGILGAFPAKNAKNQPRGDLLFFVHGFNVSFESACQSHIHNIGRLSANGWNGVFASFDWPSFGDPLQYYDDRSLARQSANALIDTALALFVQALNPDCDVNVHVMAHSMGAFVVRQAFTSAYQDTKINSKNWSISQLLFVAGDVAQGSLSATDPGGRWIDQYAGRTTSYSNRFDSVLKISDIKNGDPTPRAGRVGLPNDAPASFCGVDCSDLYSTVPESVGAELNPATPHCFYFDQDAFWQDVVLTLGGGLDRNVIPTRRTDPSATVPNRFDLQTTSMAPVPYAASLKAATLGK